ncbi:MAG TPA: type I-B CRISPR-associated protein Cas8b1/Cst1 [Chloroflexaceae bacterium]|nr:type I-B CRISPR-associated protein Cas8b1/Cst1 [Chloroflexaceae bacterium]
MLRYTGHPILDVGVATIAAFADKEDPAELDAGDLERIADYLERQYGKNPMKSYLTVIFPNSGFTQVAFDKQPEKRAAYAERVLRGWKLPADPGLDAERCVFFGTPATQRVYREMMPLIGAESGFNFFTEGRAGLPVSGEALLAIQAFPLGGTKCSGRVLIIHADAPELTWQFAAEALRANRRYLNLAAQDEKGEGSKYPRTQVIDRLLAVEQERRDTGRVSVTAYHMTNYGTSAAVEIYHVPLQIMGFLAQANEAIYRDAWQRVTSRGWEGDAAERDALGLPAHRNVLYEDLFALPAEARRFLRTYILRLPHLRRARKGDPRAGYNLIQELDLVSWPLTALFLKEVLNVDPERIEAIRTMADRLADHIHSRGDQRLFRTLLYGRNGQADYQELRTRLIRADLEVAPNGGPLFTLDEFLAVFEQSDDRYWWTMARDLLLIRIIERMHAQQQIAPFEELITQVARQVSDEDEETS